MIFLKVSSPVKYTVKMIIKFNKMYQIDLLGYSVKAY